MGRFAVVVPPPPVPSNTVAVSSMRCSAQPNDGCKADFGRACGLMKTAIKKIA